VFVGACLHSANQKPGLLSLKTLSRVLFLGMLWFSNLTEVVSQSSLIDVEENVRE
jgi:hypothetical protein